QHTAVAATQSQARQRQIRRRARELGLRHAQWPQAHRMARHELARGLFPTRHTATQQCAARQIKAARQRTLVHAGRELHHRHRPRRRQVVRIHHLQQTLRKTRKFRTQYQANARRQETEAIEQTLHIGISHLCAVHPQAPRDFGVHLGELGAHLTHVHQFAVVIVEQTRIHQAPPPRSRKSMCPLSRSISVRNKNSIGCGTHHSMPLISRVKTLWCSRVPVSVTQRTSTEESRMRGSNDAIALRIESSTSTQSISDIRLPAMACTPKFSAESGTWGYGDRSSVVCRFTVLSSQRRSRSTAMRSSACVSMAASRTSCRREGSLSVRRSSKDGCSRSRATRSLRGS